MAILHLLALGCVVCLLSRSFERRIEETLPTALLLLIPVLYVLGMFRALAGVDALAVVILLYTACFLLLHVRRGKLSAQSILRFLKTYILTPGLVAAALLGILFYYLASVRYVYYSDDLCYWAVEAKSLWHSGGLVDGAHHTAIQFSSYTPGMQLLQWWFLRLFGSFSEHVLYFAHFFTNALFLLPLMRQTTFRRWYIIPLFVFAAVAGPTMLSSYPYWVLHTDSTMGFLLGFVLCQLWNADTKDHFAPLSVGVGLVGLVLAKQTGILWALAAIMFFFFITTHKNKGILRKAWWVALCAPLVAFFSWQVFCQVQGLGSRAQSTALQDVQALFSGTYQYPAGIGLVLRHMLTAFFTLPPNRNDGWGGEAFFGLPMASWVLLFSLIPLLCLRLRSSQASLPSLRHSPEKRVSVFLLLLGLYGVGMLALSFFTVFSGEVAYWAGQKPTEAPLLDRYCIPSLFSAAYLCVDMLLTSMRCATAKGRRLPARVILGGMLALLLLCANWAQLHYMWPPVYQRAFQEEHPYDDMRENAIWLHAIPEEEWPDTRFLIASNYPVFSWGYAIAPASTVELGEAELSSDNPLKALQQFFDEFSVTHVVSVTDSNATSRLLAQVYGMELIPNQAYRVDKSTSPYALIPVP